MTAGRYNFTIEQGTKFTKVITWTDSTGALVNLTGYTAELHIVDSELDTSIITVTTTADTNGNVITLGGSAGTISILIKTVTTTTFTFSDAKYYLEMIDTTGEVSRLIQGSVSLNLEPI